MAPRSVPDPVPPSSPDPALQLPVPWQDPSQGGRPFDQRSGQQARQHLRKAWQAFGRYEVRRTPRDLADTIRECHLALALNERLSEAEALLTVALWHHGHVSLDGAVAACERLLDQAPRQAAVAVLTGELLRKAGRPMLARQAFRQAVRLAPWTQPRAHLGLGRMLSNPPQSEPWMGLLHRVFGLFLLVCQPAMWMLLSHLAVQDGVMLSVLSLGRVLESLGMGSASQKLYRWASQRFPEESVFPHRLGDMARQGGRLELATEAYREALGRQSQKPDPALARKLADAYAANDQPEAALEQLEQLPDCEDDFHTLVQMGLLNLDRNAYMRALYFFRRGLGLNPENATLHSHMAFTLYKLDDTEGAVVEYERAAALGRDPVWTATVYQTLGTLHLQAMHNPTEGVRCLQEAIRLHPANVDALALLGDHYLKSGQLDAALQTYWSCLQYAPNSADCYCYIGYILWQMDRNDEAIDAYMAALSYDPNHAITYNNLGVVYLDEEQNPGKALGLFDTALSLDPGYTLASFNRARALEALGRISEAADAYSQSQALNTLRPELPEEDIADRLSGLFEA